MSSKSVSMKLAFQPLAACCRPSELTDSIQVGYLADTALLHSKAKALASIIDQACLLCTLLTGCPRPRWHPGVRKMHCRPHTACSRSRSRNKVWGSSGQLAVSRPLWRGHCEDKQWQIQGQEASACGGLLECAACSRIEGNMLPKLDS